LTATYTATILNGYTANHQSMAARIAAIDKALAEIRSKKSGNKPLVP
jgi:hypothetical protein